MKKLTDLKIPFEWKDRRPVFLDKFFYIPSFYEGNRDVQVKDWQSPDIFPSKAPVYVEYCSGNGQWIAAKAKAYPLINWVAVEKRFDRARKIWQKLHRDNLQNLFIVCGEALTATQFYFPNNGFSKVFVNFPDPWPKLRHAKHRLIQVPFLKALALRCLPKTEINVVTDHPVFAHQVVQEMSLSDCWKPLLEAPYFSSDSSNYGSSFFADLWRKKGHSFYSFPFILESPNSCL